MSKKRPVKTKKTTRKKKNISLLHKLHTFIALRSKHLFFFGVVLISLSLFYQADKALNTALIRNISGLNRCINNTLAPAHLSIPSQDISAEIEDSTLVGNLWQISDEKVSHLRSSAVPGQDGNIVMYGHNTKNNFLNLQFLREGDSIMVQTKDGKQYAYVITSTETVLPTDVDALRSKEAQVLTLYTCVGLGDTMRLVIHAVPAVSAIAQTEGKVCRG